MSGGSFTPRLGNRIDINIAYSYLMEDNVNDVYQVGRMIFRLISSLVLIASASSFQGLAIANVKDQSQLIKYGKGHRVNGQIRANASKY